MISYIVTLHYILIPKYRDILLYRGDCLIFSVLRWKFERVCFSCLFFMLFTVNQLFNLLYTSIVLVYKSMPKTVPIIFMLFIIYLLIH